MVQASCRPLSLTAWIVRSGLFLLPWAALVAVPTPAQAQAGKPEGLYYKSWAVVVGIEDYLVAPKVPGAAADAKAMAESLRGLGFEEVIELYDKKVTSKQFHFILNDVLPRKVGRGDRLVLYFAGHAGQTTDAGGAPLGYLVPWDAQLGSVAKSVTLDQLKEFSRRVMAKHIFLILDTPVTGWDVTAPQQLSLEGRMAPEQDTDKRAVQVLTAAKSGEEIARSETTSLFMQVLKEGLSGQADRNKNGWLMATELASYVQEQVEARSKGTQHPQFARLDGDGDTILIEGRKVDFTVGVGPETEQERMAAAKAHYDEAFRLLQARKDPEEALTRLNKAIALAPSFGDAYVLKSYMQLEVLPNLDEALQTANLAVAHAPENPDSHYTLGLIQEKNGRYQEAERAYLKALEINPDYADVLLSLGLLYEDHLKQDQKAADAYRRYSELGGTDSRATKFLEGHAQPSSSQ
ncbi:MAG: caspase family protein [Nitrospiraceae bacterium]